MRYYELTPENNHFESIVADLTHRCNMACANCYIPNRKVPDMDADKLYQLIERLPKKKVFIRLMGGEPTLRKDIHEIIRKIVKLGHRPVMITNGLKLAEESYCQKLKTSGLQYLSISMNGAGDDNIYKLLDGGKYADLKVTALTNALKMKFSSINTITIIARGINENTIKEQVDLLIRCAKQAGIKYFTKRIRPVLRMRTLAPVGRHIEKNYSFAFPELISIISKHLGLNVDTVMSYPARAGSVYRNADNIINESHKCYEFPYETKIGVILIRVTDWTVNEDGVVDPGNMKRGRITQDWKIAPAFEHIKKNEGGY